MAIDTTNEKLALMELDTPWEPGLPISPGTIDQADQQQLLWGYPGILWGEAAEEEAEFRYGGGRSRAMEQIEREDEEFATLLAGIMD